MSSPFSRSQHHLSPLDGQDIVFCHGCGHEWYRDARDTSPPPPCPLCHDEFIEIVTRDNDPRAFQQTVLPPFVEALSGFPGFGHGDPFFRTYGRNQAHDHDHDHEIGHGLGHVHDHDRIHDHLHNHDHHPGPFEDSDPDEADIEEQEFHGPNNFHMYRSTFSFPSNQARPPEEGPSRQQGSGRRPGMIDPADPAAMISTFAQFLNGFRDGPAGRSGPEVLFSSEPETFVYQDRPRNTVFGQVRRTTVTRPRAAGGATSFTIATGPLRFRGGAGEAGGQGDFNTVFGNIMENVGPPNLGDEQNRGAGAGSGAGGGLPPGFPAALHHILAALLSRDTNGAFGDAVHSDEALDRIISMLMENQASSGAPPASQSALDQLERKKIDEKMLGPEGHAECTICISEVKLDEEVLLLSCKHWFHEECVVMWLKQHNTCPVCRNPVESSNGAGSNSTEQGVAGASATSSNSQSGSGPNSSSAGNGNGSTGTNTNNGGGFNNINFNRGFFAVVGGGNGGATHVFPGNVGGNSNANASLNNTYNGTNSTPSPQTAAPPSGLPPVASFRQMQNERLNAIRSTAGLPPNNYRSSRVPERSVAAERERRRRDSHSPNPGHSFPSRRYNIPNDYDEWLTSADSASSSRSRHRSPSSQSSGHYHWWSTGSREGGRSEHRSRDGYLDRNARDRERDREREREAERGRTMNPRQDSFSSNSGRQSQDPDQVQNHSHSRTRPHLHRSASSRQARSSAYSDPAPDVPASGRSFQPSWIPSPNLHFGGDHSGEHRHRGHAHAPQDSGDGSGNGNNSASNHGGGGGSGLFSFFRGLSGNGHQSSNARRRQ